MKNKLLLKREEIWKKEVVEQHHALLKEDCARFLGSTGDPVAAGIAEWGACSFCGGESFRFLYKQQVFHWERCNSCGLLQKRPRPTMKAMSRFYAEGKAVPFFEEKVLRAEREVRTQKIFGPNLERLAALLQKIDLDGGVLLDIGCSSGLFLAAARDCGLFSRYEGVEPNAASAAEAEKAGFRVHRAMFEEAEIPEENYDIITCFATFQFIHDPLAFVKKCRALLRPGGVLIFTSSNGWSPDILLLGDSSPVLPCHMLQLPDPKSFAALCELAGLSEFYVEATGELDFQIVRETWLEFPPELSNPMVDFLHRIMVEIDSVELSRDFQNLLKKFNLSGHLWMQARKL